jgi:serine/threonine-protein kinase
MAVDPLDAPEKDTRLDEVIAAYLEARESGAATDRQAWLARYPELAAELTAYFADEDQFDSLIAPLRGNASPHATPVNAMGESVASAGEKTASDLPVVSDYEIVAEIARGGMGIVYKARHRRLNRLVALKMILSGAFASTTDIARFRREAQTIAHLDHPHIVPIYEIGEHEGQPFFAMRLIEGDHLGRSVKDFIGEPRAAARLLLPVARAVHYAHQRGLLHRDLKPANILVDKAGQPHITDFGLAKWVADSAAAPHAATVRWPVGPMTGTETTGNGDSTPAGPVPLTYSGAAVGTPSYMAPEQATGRQADLTTAADIYSLGAILYELLTGRPPFRADTALETLFEAVEREPTRPGTLNRQVDRDLETICLKCLEKEPGRRYASAAALADELERYLRDEPILARPVRAGERLLRWARRRPVVAGLLVALCVSLTAGLGLTTWQWRRAEANFTDAEEQRYQAERNLAEARTQRERAEKAFRQAHHAVDTFCVRLADDRLRNVPGVQPLRKELLEGALQYYDAFVKERGDDPTLQAELARIYYRIGGLTGAIGSKDRAQAAYRQAIDIYQRLRQSTADSQEIRAGLARTLINLGFLQSDTGQRRDALQSYREAEGLLVELCAAEPTNASYKNSLSITYTNTGSILRAAGDLAGARTAFKQAHGLMRALVQEHPRNRDYQLGLAISHVNLGVLSAAVGDEDEAAASYQEARRIHEQVARTGGKGRDLSLDMGLNYRRIGERLTAREQYDEALKTLELSRGLFDQLARQNPAVPGYQSNLAVTLQVMGNAHWHSGKAERALSLYQQAANMLEKLVKLHPSVTSYRGQLAGVWFDIGLLHGQAGRGKDALPAYERSRQLQEEQVAAEPDNLDYHAALGRTLNNLGLLMNDLGRSQEAIPVLQKAIEEQRLAVVKAPHNPKSRNSLQGHYTSLARIYRTIGRPAEGLRVLEEGHALFRQLAQTNPEVGSYQASVAQSFTSLGRHYQAGGHKAEALAAFQQASALWHDLARRYRNVQHFQEELADSSFNLALAYARAGQQEEARRAYEECRDGQETLIKQHPAKASYHSELGRTLNNLGLLLDDMGRREEGLAALRQAVSAQQAALARAPDAVTYRRILSNHYGALAQTLRKAGRPIDAAAVTMERQKLWPNNPSELFVVAQDFARAAALAAERKSTASQTPQPDAERLANDAMAALRQAVSSGLTGRRRVQEHSAFAVLRDRDDFKELLSTMPK